MRDPKRLYGFYDKLQKIQVTYFPDVNFVKFILGFLDQHDRDPFFPEEDEFLKYVTEYAKSRTAPEWDGTLKYDPATYETMRDIHINCFPDWRFGQLLVNFLGCVECTRFHLTEERFVNYLKQFSKGQRPHD